MKKIFLILIVIFSSLTVNSQDWRKVTSTTYGQLSKVFFLNENLGWMVGSNGTILKTNNSGTDWSSSLTSSWDISNTLYAVYFIDANTGYVGGTKNLLLKTIDGGKTFNTISFPADSKASIKAIYFTDTNTGWVLSSQTKNAKLYFTSDGGNNWAEQINEDKSDLESMYFYSSTKGICVGGNSNALAIYSTNDGTTWTKSSMPIFPISYSKLDLHSVFMINETNAVIVGYGSSAVGLQPSIILKSTDGGLTWSYMEQAENDRVYTNLYGVTFKDENNGVAIGGDATNGYVVYRTTNGGVNWSRETFPFGFTPKSIYSLGNNIWISGSSGGSAFSNNFGSTWVLTAELPTSTLYSLQFASDQTIFAGGYGGLLLKSIDRGDSWQANYIPTTKLNPTIEDISFVDENIGYLARKNRLISKTTDGGNSWSSVLQDTSWNKTTIYGISFVNENYGMAVGKFGTGASALYITTDGGNTFNKKLGTFAEQLSGVYILDENNAVIVGREKVVSYTTDGGSTWNPATLNGLPNSSIDFNEVKFLDNNFGLACGDVLIKTEDGGKNWSYVNIPILEKEIQSCAIANTQTWYITGSKFVFKTTDAGTNWIDISDTTYIKKNANLNAITVDVNGYPWLAGSSSQIYTLAPLTGVEKRKSKGLDGFILEQNYPNPFNPTTTIKYSSNVETFIRLNVYNVLGEKISTLVNKKQVPGNYSVTFNGSDLTSGVYYYTLKFNNQIKTCKMLLVK